MVSVEEARKVLCKEAYNAMPSVRKYVKGVSKLIASSSKSVKEYLGVDIRSVEDVEAIVKKSSPVKNYVEALIGPCDDA